MHMHFNTALPPPLGTELCSNYRQEKGSFPQEQEARAGGTWREVQAAWGRQGPCLVHGVLPGELQAPAEDLPH